MAINYVEKYDLQNLVDEKFSTLSKTDGLVNKDYDFVGAKTVKVYTVNTVALGDYKTIGLNRYGTPKELDTAVQEMVMSQDKAFTFTIDKMNEDETAGALNAGTALERQLREVIVPTIDKYRFGVMATKGGTIKNLVLTDKNIVDAIMSGTEALDEAEAPMEGRQLVVTTPVYSLLKKSKDIVMETEIGQEMRIRGVVGIVDGMEVIKIASNRLPADFGFMICHNIATTAPIKLDEYKIHEDAPGISGSLVEGRVYFDAFVLDNKKKAIYVHNNKA